MVSEFRGGGFGLEVPWEYIFELVMISHVSAMIMSSAVFVYKTAA